MDNTVCASA
jgi:hypothetical protein